MFFSTYHPLVGLTSRPLSLLLSVSHLQSTSCTWHSTEQDLRPREGRGAGEDFPSAFPPPHRAPLISPHKHIWKPAVVGPSGPGLSCGDVSTCCGLCWTSLELQVPCTIWVDVGSEARVWVQFILTLHKDLRILPPPSSLGLGRESKSRLYPSPRPAAQMETVWKEGELREVWVWELSGLCSDLYSTRLSQPQCLSQEILGLGDARVLSPRRALVCGVGWALSKHRTRREVVETSLQGGWEPPRAISAAHVQLFVYKSVCVTEPVCVNMCVRVCVCVYEPLCVHAYVCKYVCMSRCV